MNATFLPRLRSSLVITLALGWALPSSAAKPPLLRHRSEVATNAYRVMIEVRGENGKEALAGNIITIARPNSSNLINLSFRGSLTPKRDASAMPFMGMGRGPRWMMPVQLNEGSELVLDPQGRVLRVSGDFPLPVPLGSLAQLFAPRFPAKADSKWEATADVALLDEPLGLGPTYGLGLMQINYSMMASYGPGGPRNSPGAVLVVAQHTETELGSATDSVVTFQQRVVLTSPLLIGTEPRLSAHREGTYAFDLVGGFLRAVDLEFQALVNSDTSTRRSTGKVKIQLLEGKERESALAVLVGRTTVDPATGQMISRKLAGDELQQVFEELRSDDDAKRRNAANRLASADLVNPPQALVNYLTNYLFDAESPVRYAAVKVVADCGTIEHVPLLLRLVKSGENTAAYSAIRGLGRLKDPRAIDVLVECVSTGESEAYSAASALENFGPAAEDPVLRLLQEKHLATKRSACSILRKVGTQKSLGPLKELMLSSDYSLNSAASEAVRAIQARL